MLHERLKELGMSGCLLGTAKAAKPLTGYLSEGSSCYNTAARLRK